MTNDNKLDPKEKADAIGILCGPNFDSVVQLLTRCSSLIHDLHANRYALSRRYSTIQFDTKNTFEENHSLWLICQR